MLFRSWGENIIGNAGMGLVFGLLYVAVVGIGLLWVYVAAQTESASLIIVVLALLGLVVIGLALIHAALQGVYAAALYRHAAAGDAGSAFSGALLNEAFRPK